MNLDAAVYTLLIFNFTYGMILFAMVIKKWIKIDRQKSEETKRKSSINKLTADELFNQLGYINMGYSNGVLTYVNHEFSCSSEIRIFCNEKSFLKHKYTQSRIWSEKITEDEDIAIHKKLVEWNNV